MTKVTMRKKGQEPEEVEELRIHDHEGYVSLTVWFKDGSTKQLGWFKEHV